jgi:hypothetical protein
MINAMKMPAKYLLNSWLLATIILTIVFSLNAQSSGTAFLSKSYISGINKICIYSYLGSEYHITISNINLCSLTIEI